MCERGGDIDQGGTTGIGTTGIGTTGIGTTGISPGFNTEWTSFECEHVDTW